MAAAGVVWPSRCISSASVAPDWGGEDGAGVAQVVEAQVRAAGGFAGGVVPAADGGGAQVFSAG